MENIYQNLFAPQVKTCGRKLDRFTLWHYLLLRAFRSPILDPKEDLTPADLLLAVELCSTPTLQRPRTSPRFLADWYWSRALLDEPRFIQQATPFCDWLDAHLAGPSFWQDSNRQGGGLTAPEIYTLAYGLTSKAHLSELQAWSKSPGQAESILATVAELEGAEIHFCDPEELASDEVIQPSSREEIEARATRDLGHQAAEAFMADWDKHHGTRN